MARPRIRIYGIALTESQLDAFEAAVESEIPAQVFDRPRNWVRGVSEDRPLRLLDIRFNTTNAANTLWTRISNKLATLRAGGLIRGLVSQHSCSHGDPTVLDCKTTSYREVVI